MNKKSKETTVLTGTSLTVGVPQTLVISDNGTRYQLQIIVSRIGEEPTTVVNQPKTFANTVCGKKGAALLVGSKVMTSANHLGIITSINKSYYDDRNRYVVRILNTDGSVGKTGATYYRSNLKFISRESITLKVSNSYKATAIRGLDKITVSDGRGEVSLDTVNKLLRGADSNQKVNTSVAGHTGYTERGNIRVGCQAIIIKNLRTLAAMASMNP